jgi:hypothetical protein
MGRNNASKRQKSAEVLALKIYNQAGGERIERATAEAELTAVESPSADLPVRLLWPGAGCQRVAGLVRALGLAGVDRPDPAAGAALVLVLPALRGALGRRQPCEVGVPPRAVRVPVGRRWMRSCARAHARLKPANQAKRCTIHQTSQPEGESPA